MKKMNNSVNGAMTRDKVNFYQTCITISHHKVHETFLTWLSIKQGAKNATLCDGDKLDLTRHVANPSVKWCELEQHDNHICISVQTEKLCWLAYGLTWMHSNVVKHMSYMHLPCNRFSDHPRMTCPLPIGISSSNRHWVFRKLHMKYSSCYKYPLSSWFTLLVSLPSISLSQPYTAVHCPQYYITPPFLPVFLS